MTRPNIGMDYTVLDCPDPAALASFYVQVLEWKSVRDEDDWHVAWVTNLGAQRVTDIPEHQTFRVYRDPVGHYFCLCLRD